MVFFPLIAITSFLIVAQDGKSPFYIPIRVGKDGLPFRLFKLRSMVADAEKTRVDTTAIDDFRITKIGHFIRKYKLDELPQFFNVLKGEMSLVGPRPLISDYLNLYNDFQKQRHNVRPGMTGLAQVKGRNRLKWNERFELDVWYVNNQNTFLDLKIIFLTFLRIFDTENIQYKDEITMYKFTGNDED